MSLLNADEIDRELARTPGWDLANGPIERIVSLKDFAEAIAYVNRVAGLAEEANHHPDIMIEWNKVTLTLITHSAGGLTENDFNLARRINAL